MKKEFKIGMFVGLIVIIVVVVVFAMKKSNSVEERALTSTVMEANFPSIDVNAGPTFDVNTSTALPGSIADANTASDAVSTGTTSTSADSTVYEQTEPIKTQRFHIVRKGDTLSSISQKYYGSSKYITKIYEANRSIMKSKNSLKPGMKLTIPEK